MKKDFGSFSTRLSYSYLKSIRYWNDYPKSAPPEFDITHNINVIVNYSILSNLMVGGRFIYSTGKPYTPQGAEFHSGRIPDYYKIDLNMYYLHSFYPGNLTVFYLMVNNITDRVNILDYHNGDKSNPVTTSYRRLFYFGISFEI